MLRHLRRAVIVLSVTMMMVAFLIAFAVGAGEPTQGETAEKVRNEDRAARRWMTLAGGLFIVGAGGCAVASLSEHRRSQRARIDPWDPPPWDPPAPE